MLQDLRLGLRRILHAPGFSLCVVLVLGLGVGAATAMGSILNALAFRTLSMPDARSLVGVSTVDARGSFRNTPLPAIDRLREAGLPVDGWCGYNSILEALESGGRIERAFGELFAGDCLEVIRSTPALGRWFTREEAPLTGSGSPVMVITDRLWKRLFDASPDVIGRQVRIQNVTATVIGVMPADYHGFSADYDFDFMLPFNAHRPAPGAYMFIGRLQRGASVEQVHDRVRAMWRPVLDEVLPEGPTRELLPELQGKAESVAGGFSILRRLYAEPVQRLTILAFALFAVVCVNVGGLMASKSSARAHEIATMRALGAGGSRIGRQFALECGLYGLAGTALGVPLAYYGSAAFATLLPIGNAPWALATTPDALIVIASVAGAVVTSLAIAALPAWIAVSGSRRFDSHRTVSSYTGRWAQAMLVLQVAVTVALVFTGGLVVRSFNTLRTLDRGYDPNGLLSLRLAANPSGYQGMDAAVYYRELINRVAALPGVESVGLARVFGTINARLAEQPVGFAGTAETPAGGVIDYATPGFFAAIGSRLVSGRDLAWTDTPDTPPVAVVSESLARSLAPDGDVVGRTIRVGSNKATAAVQIVGVVRNLSIGNVRETSVRMIFLSSLQMRETTFLTVHARTSGSPMRLAAPAADTIRAMGREHVMGAYAEDFLFTNSMVAERMGSVVSGGAAALALVISCIGLFALLSHAVQKRTREIGIRIAVGAGPAAVSRLIARHALVLVGLGLAIGLPSAIGAASMVRAMLYGVSERDWLMLALTGAAILATAAIATVIPTRRALRVDPMVALRAE